MFVLWFGWCGKLIVGCWTLWLDPDELSFECRVVQRYFVLKSGYEWSVFVNSADRGR